MHANWQAFLDSFPAEQPLNRARMFALTTHGSTPFASMAFQPGDVFVFGSETKGLETGLRESFPPSQRIRLPMRPDNRSLNLSNTVAVVVYEAWRQNNFAGGQ
ncbi:tRNA (cytidine(34)-2'-O)-methyltransferase [compost metagenome]